MGDVHLDLLGPPDLRVDGGSVTVETRKAVGLLAYVLIEGPQRRDALDVLFWPDSDARRARAALRRTLTALRKVLPDGVLAEGDEVALESPVSTDLDEVERILGNGAVDPPSLARADALHRGEFLDGLWFRDADPFEHWRRETAEHVARRHARLLERWTTAHVERGEYRAAIEIAQRRLAMDPLHEPSHQQLMVLYAWQGDRGAAARQYATCVRVLDEELGVAPLPRTAALDRAVRAGTIEPPTARRDGSPNDATEASPPPQPSPQPAALPLVGRDDDLARLVALHERCDRDGAMALISGEAGIGKTRLVAELAARTSGTVVRISPHPGETSLAYAPVTAALRELGPRLHELEPSIREELARLAPDVAGVRPPVDSLTSPGARTRLVDACATAITSLVASPQAPGLLVVDDLDRADPETRELVSYLGHRLKDRPLLVAVTCRDALRLPPPALELRLQRLTVDDVRVLAASQDVTDEDTVSRLHVETEGVPFLVVAYLGALSEGRADWDLPSDGRELVRGRLERLDEVARQVLSAAAILGGHQPPDVLERVSGRSETELVDAIEGLTRDGLLSVTAAGLYGLTHDKIRTVALEETSHIRRRLLHRRAADALATTTPAVAAATLAHHLERAGRDDEAAAAHAAAGRRAAELYANDEAIDHLETALALGHPDAGSTLLLLGDLFVRTGAYAKAADRYTRAAANGAGEARVEERLGALALRRGDHAGAGDHLRLALDAEPDTSLRVEVLAGLAQGLVAGEDLDGAAARAAEAVALADGGAEVAPGAASRAHNIAGLVARRRGDLAAARRHLRASLDRATGVEQRAATLNNLALVLGEDGALDEALVVAQEALDAGRAAGDRHRLAALLSNLADLLHAAGRTDEALDLQRAAAERFAGVGDQPIASPEIWRLIDW